MARDLIAPIYRLRIALLLPRLHRVFQVVMSWTDSHLHEFTIGGRRYGQPDPEWPEQSVLPERSVRLADVILRPNARFTYLYDFGDSWDHEEHDQMLTWAGGRFDPEAFDLDAVNRRLRRFRGQAGGGKRGSRWQLA